MAAEDYTDFDDCFEEADSRHSYRSTAAIRKAAGPPQRFLPTVYNHKPGQPRNMPANHGEPWFADDDARLEELWHNRWLIKHLMIEFQRTEGSIRSRLQHLGFDPDNPNASKARPQFNVAINQPSLNVKDLKMQSYQHVLALLQHGYTTVEVYFPENSHKDYTYKISGTMAEGLEKGDYLVVPARDEFKLVRVRKVHPKPKIDVSAPFDFKWVVQRVDFTAYNDQTSREAEAIERMQEAERADAQRKALEMLVGDEQARAEILKLIAVG